jgi:co-chaperonin GroES (HSP10)
MLKPLGHRVLIRPDEQPTESQSGIILPDEHDHVSMSGTVVAVGKGSKRLFEVRHRTASNCLTMATDSVSRKAIQAYIDRLVHEYMPTVCVGDRVAYSVEAGLTFTEDGQTYLVMNEDDLVVLVVEDAVA